MYQDTQNIKLMFVNIINKIPNYPWGEGEGKLGFIKIVIEGKSRVLKVVRTVTLPVKHFFSFWMHLYPNNKLKL